jgi:carbon-monoxide dehydrogenase large subunit
VTKARAIAANMLKVEEADLKFDEGVYSTNKTNRTLSVKEIAAASFDTANLPRGMEPGLFATAVYKAPVNNYPNGCHTCELEIDRETGKVEITRYSVVDDFGTVLNPLLLHGRSTAASPRVPAGPHGGHPFRCFRSARHRVIHGLRHAACARPLRHGG